MRFNFLQKKPTVVTNYEDEKAFVLTPQLELYTAVATAALTDNFYEKADAQLQRITELIAKNDPADVAALLASLGDGRDGRDAITRDYECLCILTSTDAKLDGATVLAERALGLAKSLWSK